MFAQLNAMRRRAGPQQFDEYRRERDGSQPKQAASKQKDEPTIYTLTVKCVQGMGLTEPCTRVIEMRDDATLSDLSHAILKSVHFHDDHLSEFYAGRHHRRRDIAFDEVEDSEADELKPIQLKEIWPLPQKVKLFYWFDFGDDWIFQITKGQSRKRPEKGVRYPRVIKEVGPAPQQYD